MLLILSGLPGSGKTTLAREISREREAVHVRIDSIEAALRRAGCPDVRDAGYRVGYAVAEDNLRLGRTVVADSVNPLAITRRAWKDVAVRSQVLAVDVEIVCSDAREHRRRIETRTSDLEGLRLPTWQEVMDREYHDWEGAFARIDTAGLGIAECVASLRSIVSARS